MVVSFRCSVAVMSYNIMLLSGDTIDLEVVIVAKDVLSLADALKGKLLRHHTMLSALGLERFGASR
jgi:hypothetical protein